MVKLLKLLNISVILLILAGCSGDMRDLEEYVKSVLARKPGPIEGVPSLSPYESYRFSEVGLRDPFIPLRTIVVNVSPGFETRQGTGITPDRNRPRELLESFPLDSLAMVGTITKDNVTHGLIKTPDGTIYTVIHGNYMGQDFGKIIEISEFTIKLSELVPDGFGTYEPRENSIVIAE